MELNNEYEIAAPADTLWDVLNDVERVAPFVPGFELQEAEGDVYKGTIKIKVGAITVSYNAEIEVLERDAQARRVVMAISGRERRGPGSVNARVTSSLEPTGEKTKISLATDVQVTGRVAQFGQGVLADVSGTLLRQFVDALEQHLRAAAEPEPAAAGASAGSTQAPPPPPGGDNVLDIGAVAGPAVLKRAAPILAGGLLVAIVAFIVGRRR